MALEPFVWGRGGSKKTPEQVAREREIADALMAQGVDFSPVQHPLQGLARVATAAAGAYRGYKADKAEQEGRESGRKAVDDVVKAWTGAGGGTPATGQPAANPTPSPAPSPASGVPAGKDAFVSSLMPAAMEASKRTGVDPRIIVAQAALESGWGKSAPGNNYFGIKSHGKGGGQTLATTEVVNGQPVRVNDSFRTYASPVDSVMGYADFITENPRYTEMRQAQGLDAQIEALGRSGYATDPEYASKIRQIAMGLPEMSVGGAAGANQPMTGMNPDLGIASAPAPQSAAPAPQPQAGGMADIAALLPALENEWLSDGQRMVLQAMLEQRMKAGQPVDPIEVNGRLVNPQTGQVVADFSDPKTATVGNALIDVRTGKPIYEAPAEAPKPVTLGEGGMLVDPTTGQMIAENPADGKAPDTRVIKQADGSEVAVQWDPKANAWMPMPAPEGGAAVRGSPKLTEAQSKDVGFYNRGIQAAERLETMESALLNVTDAAAGNVPLVGNMLTSADKQQADQAAREFLAVILRKDTGAAVTEQEFDIYGKMYIPRVGDSPEVLAQKREARKTAIESIRLGLGQVGDQVFGGQPVVDPAQAAPATTPAAPTASPAPAPDASSVIQKARDAIAKGADPEAVKKRLMDAGIDPSGL